MNEELATSILPILRGLRLYHRHSVYGLGYVPTQGAALIACTHSLATYDMLMLMAAVFEHNGRFPRALIDRLFYKFPRIGNLMEGLGCVVGCPENAKSILSNGEMLYVAPGGMEESLRSSQAKYQIRWQKRKGFARLSIEAGVPVILAACPAADDIYEVKESPVTRWAYDRFRIPLFFARGLGPTPIPRPQRLAHYLS